MEDYDIVPDIQRELDFFAINPFNKAQKLTIDLFLEFITYDSKGEAVIGR